MSQAGQETEKPSALRRRRLLWNGAGLFVALAAVIAALCLWCSSSQFENMVRKRIVAQLAAATGGRVEMRAFRWRLTDLQAEADGIVIHGLEDAGEAPYAQVARLRAGISILGFLSPRILLRDLDVLEPRFHLIVYPDGSTNQPHPSRPAELKKPVMETLFDLQAGHVSVEQGSFTFDSRATGFDFANRYLPLDFQANDVSVQMKYVPGGGTSAESYHIETGVRDLDLLRGGKAASASVFPAYIQASIDLTRDAAWIRSLSVTEHTRGEKERVLKVAAKVSDFAHPRWEGTASGEFDLHLLNPILGYPATPEGVARMSVSASGDSKDFRIDGPVHVENGAYVDAAINAHKLRVDTRVHVDSNLMHFGDVFIRFAQGGEIEGDLALEHWQPHPPSHSVVTVSQAPPEAATPVRRRHFWNQKKTPLPARPARSRDILVKNPETEITVHGKISTKFNNVALDTVLDIVGRAPFNRLGVDTVLNGPATAEWGNGDVRTLKVGATLALSPSGHAPAGEVPGTGVIDAAYEQRTGSVDVQRLELNLPASQITASGRLGAYPMSSETALSIDFRSHNLGDFDTTQRTSAP